MRRRLRKRRRRATPYPPRMVFLRNSRLHDLAGGLGRLALGQGVDMFHAGGDFAPDSILAIQEGGVVEADEELAVGAVRIHGAGHGTDAPDMRFAAEFGLQVEIGRATCRERVCQYGEIRGGAVFLKKKK